MTEKTMVLISKINKRKNDIGSLADYHGWFFFEYQDNTYTARFRKGNVVINVYLSKMTACVVADGKTNCHRNCTDVEIEKLFMNQQ